MGSILEEYGMYVYTLLCTSHGGPPTRVVTVCKNRSKAWVILPRAQLQIGRVQ